MKRCRERDACLVAGCGQRHHSLLHPISEEIEQKKEQLSEHQYDEKKSTSSDDRKVKLVMVNVLPLGLVNLVFVFE